MADQDLASAIHPGRPLVERLEHLQQLAASGQIEPWKAALLGVWLSSEAAQNGELLTPDRLVALLQDPRTVAELRAKVEGPWDALAKQAAVMASHARVGEVLATYGSTDDP